MMRYLATVLYSSYCFGLGSLFAMPLSDQTLVFFLYMSSCLMSNPLDCVFNFPHLCRVSLLPPGPYPPGVLFAYVNAIRKSLFVLPRWIDECFPGLFGQNEEECNRTSLGHR
ncbi:uncharacterized protein EURHEDRAFT_141296 [Aspergillus ruber CBS 135680]|uniref:Uncharacterized protein n=1 Tax=Aspergillus ruber (strain CBS 135680) TaxID=1388766 RepID=A0A017SA35_ASPRC|nr:uncharacterized protein EURHEDRAFT_141296 [Aspergillus ruber CBS 135680]EYE93661.1 hypothetical protein EURHEDRAFT_141296 [Aspergillus ruber CBS 135680]